MLFMGRCSLVPRRPGANGHRATPERPDDGCRRRRRRTRCRGCTHCICPMRLGADVVCGVLALCFIAANCAWSLLFITTGERQLRVLHTPISQPRPARIAAAVVPAVESDPRQPLAAVESDSPQPLAVWLCGSGSPLSGCPDDCHPQVHADMWGQAIGAGGARNLQDSPAACCAACRAHAAAAASGRGKPCNVWVHCGDAVGCGSNYRHCWLKHQPDPMAAPMVGGLGVSWGGWCHGRRASSRRQRRPSSRCQQALRQPQLEDGAGGRRAWAARKPRLSSSPREGASASGSTARLRPTRRGGWRPSPTPLRAVAGAASTGECAHAARPSHRRHLHPHSSIALTCAHTHRPRWRGRRRVG